MSDGFWRQPPNPGHDVRVHDQYAGRVKQFWAQCHTCPWQSVVSYDFGGAHNWAGRHIAGVR